MVSCRKLSGIYILTTADRYPVIRRMCICIINYLIRLFNEAFNIETM
jgi:hypothetical protein